jgi:hypothetical protein
METNIIHRFKRQGDSKHTTNAVALVRERTIPAERPPLVGEVSANFCRWARSNFENTYAFAKHLAQVSQLYPTENELEEEETLIQLLETP